MQPKIRIWARRLVRIGRFPTELVKKFSGTVSFWSDLRSVFEPSPPDPLVLDAMKFLRSFGYGISWSCVLNKNLEISYYPTIFPVLSYSTKPLKVGSKCYSTAVLLWIEQRHSHKMYALLNPVSKYYFWGSKYEYELHRWADYCVEMHLASFSEPCLKFITPTGEQLSA
jgi:hypothetical protein